MPDPFWAKVDTSAGLFECWPWTAANNGVGYGIFWRGRANKVYAHRLAYELLRGPIPEGLQLDHLCRNRACVNPAHLEPVTNRENSLRGNSRNAINARKTHCKHGHNNWGKRRDSGYRVCLTCEPSRAGGTSRSVPDRLTSPERVTEWDSVPAQNETPGHPTPDGGPRRPAPAGSFPPEPAGAPSSERVP